MSPQFPEGVRIDYLGFNVRLHPENSPFILGTLLNSIRGDDCNLVEGDSFALTEISPNADSDGRRRYKVEAWGEYSIELAALVPLEWFDDLSRVDVQAKLYGATRETVKADALMRFAGKKGARNVIPYDTKNRKKSNQRDVGGAGCSIGSRKSKRYTITCARADEVPYVETRAGGDCARDIGRTVLLTVDEKGPNAWYDALVEACWQFYRTELHQATGLRSAEGLKLAMDDARERERQMVKAMVWAEEEQEREWWESLSAEEQEEILLQGWSPSTWPGPKHRQR